MNTESLYSIVFELHAPGTSPFPSPIQGHHLHALFLNLVRQFDPALSARLHDEPGPRPFTTALLQMPSRQASSARHHAYYLRITLLDGGFLWHRLSTYFLEAGPIVVSLQGKPLQLVRLFSTPVLDPTGWANTTTWSALAMVDRQPYVSLHFVTPTAFSVGDRQFALFPEPLFLWESLLRVWNSYAPERYTIEKNLLRRSVTNNVTLIHADIHTGTSPFAHHVQKGFLGSCGYHIQAAESDAQCLLTLAVFAPYAGVGYKSTMGMGQVRVALGFDTVVPTSKTS